MSPRKDKSLRFMTGQQLTTLEIKNIRPIFFWMKSRCPIEVISKKAMFYATCYLDRLAISR